MELICIVINDCLFVVVCFDVLVFFFGQVLGQVEDIYGQICEVLVKIDVLLVEVGLCKECIFSVIIYLKDIVCDFVVLNEVWIQWLLIGQVFSWIIVQVELVCLLVLVEIIVVVVRG